jgi:dephospho-CoA kinase
MKPFVLGLTGSIGMGKSTTAAMFAAEGIPVWDADSAVHRLYARDGAGARVLLSRFPEIVATDGSVDRKALGDLILKKPPLLNVVNELIHPLVAADRAAFLAGVTADIVLLDIPLLYEIGAEVQCDAVVVVTAPAEVQKARVLGRGSMSEAMFETILGRQIPDSEKRRRADYVIETTGMDSARVAVKEVLADVHRRIKHHA